ncbi:MAG: nucleotide exchange factor GrpE [Chloroflexi bacterium]|nr:MAG: nucleotide exchange factor GrpE [Chloroflexota bacterium]
MSEETVINEKEKELETEEVTPTDTGSENTTGVGEATETEATETKETEQTPSLEEQLAAAKEEAARNLEGWMRTQAEFANARKRLEKQRAEAYVNAAVELAAKLLPVIDDFERAFENVPPEIAENSWLEGMQLVLRKLQGVLENMNVTPIEAVGQPFDPLYHEALSQESSDEYESGTVVRELQKGYKLGDRVIRPALVVVAE